MSETKVADKASTTAREARIDRFCKARSIRMSIAGLRLRRAPSIIFDLVRELSEAGFAAVLTKDHDYAGVATAQLITERHPGAAHENLLRHRAQ